MRPLKRWIGDELWSTEQQRWTWRLSGTRTPSPPRYLPPKLNSRFLVGECKVLLFHYTRRAHMSKNVLCCCDIWQWVGAGHCAGCVAAVGSEPSRNSLCAPCFTARCSLLSRQLSLHISAAAAELCIAFPRGGEGHTAAAAAAGSFPLDVRRMEVRVDLSLRCCHASDLW